jgi:hypothetical protein
VNLLVNLDWLWLLGHLSGLSVANQQLVFDRILKCNHPSLAEGNKEKLMSFYVLLLQYLQAVQQASSCLSLEFLVLADSGRIYVIFYRFLS